MDRNLLLRNRGVRRLVVGIPEGQRQIRARIETENGDVVTLQEATLAALLRAYTQISTHPSRAALELTSGVVQGGKEGFALHQLMETAADEGALRRELAWAPTAAPRGVPAANARSGDSDAPTHDGPPLHHAADGATTDAGSAWKPLGPSDEDSLLGVGELSAERSAPQRAEAVTRAAGAGAGGGAEGAADVAHRETAPSARSLPELQPASGPDGDSVDDLELEPDDGPVFGETPTVHSPQQAKDRSRKRGGRRGRG
jgi:hypothetical protein